MGPPVAPKRATADQLWARLWKLANKPFTILILSSVVLSSLTSAYTNHQESTAKARTISELDYEIALRLHSLRQIVGDKVANESILNLVRIHDLFDGMSTDIFVHHPSLAAFEGLSMGDLMNARIALSHAPSWPFHQGDIPIATLVAQYSYAQHFSDILSDALFKAHNENDHCDISMTISVRNKKCKFGSDQPRQSEIYKAISREKLKWTPAEKTRITAIPGLTDKL